MTDNEFEIFIQDECDVNTILHKPLGGYSTLFVTDPNTGSNVRITDIPPVLPQDYDTIQICIDILDALAEKNKKCS